MSRERRNRAKLVLIVTELSRLAECEPTEQPDTDMTISATATRQTAQHRKKSYCLREKHKQGRCSQTSNKTEGNKKTVSASSTVRFACFPQSIFSTLDHCLLIDNRNTDQQIKSSLGAERTKKKKDTYSISLTL